MQHKHNEPLSHDELQRRINDPDIMTDAMQAAIDEALRDHQRAGQPICTWQDGKVVWIPPEAIQVGGRNQNND